METIFEINYRDPIGDIDNDIDEEMTPFQYALEELRRYVDPDFYIELKDGYRVHFYLYADITSCYGQIVESVKRVKIIGKAKIIFGFVSKVLIFIFIMTLRIHM